MLIENLYKSWQHLAPHEANQIWGFDESEIESWLAQPINQAIFQGYLQRCITSRSSWDLTIFSCNDGATIESDAIVQCEDEEFRVNSKVTSCEALFLAYITALASKRPLLPGQGMWVDLAGDKIELHGEAFAGIPSGVMPTEAYYSEDGRRFSYAKGDDCYYANGDDLGTRVFFKKDKQRLATTVQSFLGLANSETPSREGLLLYVKAVEQIA